MVLICLFLLMGLNIFSYIYSLYFMLKRQVSFSFFCYVNFFFLVYILYIKYIVSYSH